MRLCRTFASRSVCGSVFSFLLRMELLAHRVNPCSVFEQTVKTAKVAAVLTYIPSQQHKRF